MLYVIVRDKIKENTMTLNSNHSNLCVHTLLVVKCVNNSLEKAALQ